MQTDGIEKVIAERLQEIVKIHGIGIPELAERCGLKRQRAKKLMNGEVKMSIAEAVSIANEFQVSLEYLLGRYPYPLPAPQTDEEWLLYEKLGQMDENEAQKYLEMMMPMKRTCHNLHSFPLKSLCSLWLTYNWIYVCFRANMYLPKGKKTNGVQAMNEKDYKADRGNEETDHRGRG